MCGTIKLPDKWDRVSQSIYNNLPENPKDHRQADKQTQAHTETDIDTQTQLTRICSKMDFWDFSKEPTCIFSSFVVLIRTIIHTQKTHKNRDMPIFISLIFSFLFAYLGWGSWLFVSHHKKCIHSHPSLPWLQENKLTGLMIYDLYVPLCVHSETGECPRDRAMEHSILTLRTAITIIKKMQSK